MCVRDIIAFDPASIPYGAGPIIRPGEATVLIGGQLAAVVGKKASYVGLPSTIAKGSSSVLIGGKPMARVGNTTAHGGVITSGCPTVRIGD